MESAAFTAVIERNSGSDDKANAADPKVMRWRVYNNLYINVIFMLKEGLCQVLMIKGERRCTMYHKNNIITYLVYYLPYVKEVRCG